MPKTTGKMNAADVEQHLFRNSKVTERPLKLRTDAELRYVALILSLALQVFDRNIVANHLKHLGSLFKMNCIRFLVRRSGTNISERI